MLTEYYKILIEGIRIPFSYIFTDTDKRIFLLYIASSTLLAFYIFKKKKSNTNFVSYLFPKKVWLSKSAIIDYYFIFFNSYIKIILIAPLLIYGYYLSFYVNKELLHFFGKTSLTLSRTTLIITYTITLTIISDFSSFLMHYAQHKIPFLWRFHKIHHSARVLNPITQYRIHPVELIINNIRGIVVIGLVTGVFDFLSPIPLEKWTYIGVNIFHFVFLFLGANLRHSHIKLSYFSCLEYIFISPFQHQIHHSNKPEHFDKNMGSKFAIWDWLFGTLVRSKNIEKKLQFGLGDEDKNYASFKKNLINPFKRKT